MDRNRRWRRSFVLMASISLAVVFSLYGSSSAQDNYYGDMTLDGIDNTIADFALYSSYYALGLGAFSPLPNEAVIAESDVNCDGTTLTVADMVQMYQIILGSADRCIVPDNSHRALQPGASQDVQASFTVSIEPWVQSTSGDFRVLIRLNSQTTEINGFEFQISYDPTGLVLIDVVPGSPELADWQVLGYNEITSTATRTNLRIVGYPWDPTSGSNTADLANWSSPVLVELRFEVTNPQTSFAKPFRFSWSSFCGDNSLAVLDWQGSAFETPDHLAVSSAILDYDGADLTGEPLYGGESGACLTGELTAPSREIIFHNGLIEFEALCCETTGDYNGDGNIDLSDVIGFVQYLFLGGQPPACPASVNIDGDPGCTVDLTDLVRLVSYLFTGGAPPAPCMEECM